MEKFTIGYEGTRFSLTVFADELKVHAKPVSYEFLIKQENGNTTWKWIYLPCDEKSIRIGEWIIPCIPTPCFNTENGISLTFDVRYGKQTFSISAIGEFKFKNNYFTDSFVASCFEKVLTTVIKYNVLSIPLEQTESITFIPSDNNEEQITLLLTYKRKD